MSDKVKKAMNAWHESRAFASSVVATVVSVNTNVFTCTLKPIDGGAEYHGVRLKPSISADDHGIIAIPEVGSDVVFGILGKGDTSMTFIIQYSVVKEWRVKVKGGITLVLKDGELLLNGEQHGGLVIIQKLVEEINDLKQAFNTHVHSGVTTGAGVSAVPTQPVAKTQRSQIENTKVKHG